MGDRRCCCLGCFVFADNFNRSDSTDLGSDWNEVTGNWGIGNVFGQELVENWASVDSGTADALVICTQAVPFRSAGEMYVQVELYGPSLEVDDVYRIYPCCPNTTAVGSLVAEFTYLGDYYSDGHQCWRIDITDGSEADTHISIMTTGADLPTYIQLYVCADKDIGMVQGGVDQTESKTSTWIESDSTGWDDGKYAGLGHNNTAHKNVFENFEMGELRTATEVCWPCFCMCDLIPMPITLTGTFMFACYDPAQRSCCINGLTWEMNYLPGLSAPAWSGELEITTVESPPVVQTIKFTLTCDAGWHLSIAVFEGLVEVACGCFSSTWYGTPKYPSARTEDEDPQPAYWSTCDPISLVYGPFSWHARDDCNWCYKQNDPIACLMAIPPDPIYDGPECNGEFWIYITA